MSDVPPGTGSHRSLCAAQGLSGHNRQQPCVSATKSQGKGLTAAQDEALLLCHLRLVWTVVLKNSACMYGRIYTGLSLYKDANSNAASVVRLTVASPGLCIMALFEEGKKGERTQKRVQLELMTHR